MSRLAVWLELDTQFGSGDELTRAALGWLDDGSREWFGPVREALDRDPDPPWRRPERDSVPWGPPGSVWGQLGVTKLVPNSLRVRRSERPPTAKGWAWLTAQLRQHPYAADVQIRVLVDGGPALWLRADTEETSPGWLRLNASTNASDFEPGHPGGERWLALVRGQAERINPGYGQIGIWHAPRGETALENRLPVDFGRNRPQYTVGESRQWLRGYAWVTIAPQELADRLGGVAALRASGVFHEVAQLGQGGVWLQATRYFGQYDVAKATEVFEVLAPVLRPGLPQLPQPAEVERYGPFLLVYEDASTRTR